MSPAKPPQAKPIAAKPAATGGPAAGTSGIDKQLIRELAELLAETGLSEIEWSEGGVQVRVARTPAAIQMSAVTAAAPAKGAASGAAADLKSVAEDLAAHPGAVKSPMVGTVYHAPEPGAPPFVRVGDTVTQGQTVLIVEAMKTMNPIPAPCAGRVARLLTENQQPVEYGQVMMVIE
jgi:acetyl-CoA carboxylase biotin carboxyl carrier protein